MKRIILPLLLLALIASGCKFFKGKSGKDVDSTAILQAKQDSINRVEAQKIEMARAAREQAIQDSLRRVQEYNAKFRYNIIVGSFKVPTNADSWQMQVEKMGFKNTKIVQSSNGFRMVSIGAYESYSKAFNQINKINEGLAEPIEMWIYEGN
jgi:cell division protein FtsN